MGLDIVYITSEVSPYSFTGGLAEVAAALPRALKALGHQVTVLSPYYRQTAQQAGPLSRPVQPLRIRMGNRKWSGDLLSRVGHDRVRQFFLDIPELFDRAGIYGENGQDYADNPLRYAVLCRSAVAIQQHYDIPVDIFHGNDWQGALAPFYLRRSPHAIGTSGPIGTVFTIHNLAFQGSTGSNGAFELGLTDSEQPPESLEFFGTINFMKGGILCADAITTVSPTYAREICSPQHGLGLDGVLNQRRESLIGILNGVDYSIWSPEKDIHLAAHYDAFNQNGKRKCKAALQAHFGLNIRPRIPLLGIVTRLAAQKGTDLLLSAVAELLEAQAIQLVILGEGENGLESACRDLARRYPARAAVEIGYSEPLAHQVFAGADIFAMPSRFEPCGLSQLYAMRYGAIPVVRDTGGLHDTVEGYRPDSPTATGFVFKEPTVEALYQALQDAIQLFHEDVKSWRGLVHSAMLMDFSWRKAAEQYVAVYQRVLDKVRSQRVETG